MAAHKKHRRRLRPILRFMLKYAGWFLLVTAVLLVGFWYYLAAFEKSQPTYAIRNEVEKINADLIHEKTADYIASLDHSLQSEETSRKILNDLLLNHTDWSKKTTESDETTSVYVLSAESTPYATLTFRQSEKKDLFGFHAYELINEEWNFDRFTDAETVTVPADWSVSYEGTQLDASHIQKEGEHYEFLDTFYGTWNPYNLPTLTTYHVENVLKGGTFEVRDQAGNPVDMENYDPSDQLTKANDEERERAESFVAEFLPGYVQCLSNANHNAVGNYNALSPYLVSGGELSERLYQAIEGQTWANSNGDTITNTVYNGCWNLGSSLYLCDITYTLETIGTNGAVESTTNARLLMQDNGWKLLALDIATY